MHFKKINKEKVKRVITKSINVILTLAILNLLAGNFGIFSSLYTHAIAFFLLVAVAIININFRRVFNIIRAAKKGVIEQTILGFIFIVLSITILLAFSSGELWLIQLPLFILGIDLIIRATDEKKPELFLLSFMCFSYALFFIILQNIPQLFMILEQFSLSISQIVSNLANPVSLGASSSGLWIALAFVFSLFTIFIFSEKKRDKKHLLISIGCFFGIAIGWIIFILIQSLYPFENLTDRINAQYMLFIMNAVVSIPYLLKVKTKTLNLQFPSLKDGKSKTKWKVAVLCILLFFSVFFLTIYPPNISSVDKKNVAIYRPGIGVGLVDLPEYGNYGRYAAGFFGLLPQHLDSFNYDVEMINENITQEILERNDILVIINLNETFSSDTLDVIWNFVENGGSLLVLGDHTDIGGIMDPLNTLLEPVAIEFKFDSAIPAKSQWKSCYHLMHHPITEGIATHNEISISVGASLNIDITKGGFPIILGKGGFSDIGNYLDPERSYLGDYEYNLNEQLSDVVLVAGAYYGSGRVVVFGDTSSFQNMALPNSNPLISNVFSWLTSTSTVVFSYLWIGVSLILLIVAIFVFTKLGMKFYVVLPIVLCISLVVSSIINPIMVGDSIPSGPIFYIDSSHGERINIEPYNDDSTDGLMLNFARNEYSNGSRYLPFMLKDFSEERILQSKVVAIIAPTKEFTSSEADFIEEFISNGGLLILSTGFQEKHSVQKILDKFDLDILGIPLGPVPYIEENQSAHMYEPLFVDSWPIQIIDDANLQIFYNVEFGEETYPLVVFKKYVSGGILLVSDSQFLLDKNLESLYNYWPGNIEFIKNIIEELKTEGVPQ